MGEDYFAELGLARRLNSPGTELQGCYDRRCREVHPDAGGDPGDFQRVQRAHGVLRSPGRRLRHWLELAGVGWSEGGELDGEVTGLFGELGLLLQRSEEVGRRKARGQSVLARSLAEREAIGILTELEGARETVERLIEERTEQFAEFEERGAAACGELAGTTARSLLFLEKWERQLREAWAKLAG